MKISFWAIFLKILKNISSILKLTKKLINSFKITFKWIKNLKKLISCKYHFGQYLQNF